MRIYTPEAMETLRARQSLAEWRSEGLVTEAQYEQLQQETVSELRACNVFLRVVLFFFTLLCVAAATGLLFLLFEPSRQNSGFLLFLQAVVCYGAAEVLVKEARFYRHGIEEALAVCSIGFLCAGLESAFGPSAANPDNPVSSIAAAGVLLSLWIWHRFGLWYVFLIAMSFVVALPTGWTASASAQHAIIATFYAAGWLGIAFGRRQHRFDYLDLTYSTAEAFLWLGIYLALNLKILVMGTPAQWFSGGTPVPSPFGRTFYWTTWALGWCLPPVILARGIRLKDRFVLGAGGVSTLLTFVANKPYLGWPRHTWDPMLLGIVLTGAALLLRRWLQQGPGGVRHGFTGARLSKQDGNWRNAGSSVLGLFSPLSLVPRPEDSGPDRGLDGGASGGGGASRDF